MRNTYAPLLYTQSGRAAGDEADNELKWLPIHDARIHALSYADSSIRLMVDAGAMLRVGSVELGDSTHPFAMGNMNARVMGSLNENFGFMLYLSNGLLFSGESNYVKFTDGVLSRTLKFTELEQKFFDRYVGYVQYQSDHMRIRYGREHISWGYSPIDNLVHSRFAPLSDGLFMDFPFKSIRFSTIHHALDGTDTSGKAIVGKFMASHRLQIEATNWLSVGINDMVVYSGRGIDLAYLNPLAFYVSTGLNSRNKSEMDNSLLGMDLAFRPFSRTLLYGAILFDDLSFESISDTSAAGNNNKSIYQLGASQLIDETPLPLLLSTEYVRASAFCYSHRDINNSWTQMGAPLGYNMQPNSDRIALQTKLWLSARSFLQLDFDYTRWGENFLDSTGAIRTAPYVPTGGDTLWMPVGNVGADMTRGDGDFLPGQYSVGNTFLRGNLSITRRLQVLLSTEVIKNVFLDARALYLHRTGGNNPLREFWAWVELRIGY